jgi:hypothetical protein
MRVFDIQKLSAPNWVGGFRAKLDQVPKHPRNVRFPIFGAWLQLLREVNEPESIRLGKRTKDEQIWNNLQTLLRPNVRCTSVCFLPRDRKERSRWSSVIRGIQNSLVQLSQNSAQLRGDLKESGPKGERELIKGDWVPGDSKRVRTRGGKTKVMD